MFEAFYNLSDNPFRLTPDPKFCFRHPSHDQAHAYLQYALKLGEGFIMVTGRPGIGKTTLAQVFLAELEFTEVVAARVASVNMEAEDLMRLVAYAYNIDVEGLDKATILVRLRQFFIDQVRAEKRVLLIIDEAQGLHYSALEELRLLADMQMESRPLLQLFLVGQEKLRDLIQEPAMEQFKQRVIGACHLEPLCLTDTRDYMEHRFRKADWKGDPELTGEALLAIYQFSKGVPRHINKICTRLLLDGFMGEKHTLNGDDVRKVAEELRAERLEPLGDTQADATDADNAQLVPGLENGTLTLADLALHAEPEQPPIVRPAPPDAVAKGIETTDTRYTKQATAAHVQTAPGAANAGPGMVSSYSVNNGPSNRHRHRPYSAAGLFKRRQRQRTEQVRINPWGSKSAPHGRRHLWFEGRPGMWAGAIAVAALALTLTLLLNFTGENVGSHREMVKKTPDTAGMPMETGEVSTLIASANYHEGIKSASLETIVHEPVKSPAETRNNNHRLVNNKEFSQQDGKVPGLTVQGHGLAMPEIKRGSFVADDTAVSNDDKTIVSGGVEEIRNSSEQSVPAAAPSNVAVVISQDIVDTATKTQPVEPPVEQKDNALVEQKVVVTNSAVAVNITGKSGVRESVSREDRIIELLSQAQRALRSDRLLIPPDHNAYQYYQQVLKLEPDNNAALFGMDQIVGRYVALARKALDRQDTDKATMYIARGSRVLPGDSRLIALQEEMNPPPVEPEVQVETQPVAESKPKDKNPLSWFKGIFGKGSIADEKYEVPVEDHSY